VPDKKKESETLSRQKYKNQRKRHFNFTRGRGQRNAKSKTDGLVGFVQNKARTQTIRGGGKMKKLGEGSGSTGWKGKRLGKPGPKKRGCYGGNIEKKKKPDHLQHAPTQFSKRGFKKKE